MEMAVFNGEMAFFRGFTHHRKRATFTFANCSKSSQVFSGNRHHITLLRFITPKLAWRHTRLFVMHRAQAEYCPHTRIVYQFRECVRDTTSTYVMDTQNWILLAQLPATVNHFLCAAFQLWVAALYRIKIQVL